MIRLRINNINTDQITGKRCNAGISKLFPLGMFQCFLLLYLGIYVVYPDNDIIAVLGHPDGFHIDIYRLPVIHLPVCQDKCIMISQSSQDIFFRKGQKEHFLIRFIQDPERVFACFRKEIFSVPFHINTAGKAIHIIVLDKVFGHHIDIEKVEVVGRKRFGNLGVRDRGFWFFVFHHAQDRNNDRRHTGDRIHRDPAQEGMDNGSVRHHIIDDRAVSVHSASLHDIQKRKTRSVRLRFVVKNFSRGNIPSHQIREFPE